MERTRSGYTGGEIMTVVSPIVNVEPEDMAHVAVIVFTTDGMLIATGCDHVPYLAEMVHSETGTNNRPAYRMDRKHQKKRPWKRR
jgi:hypothetical protein